MKQLIRFGACLFLIAATDSFGHEGHQPLPTKGVEVDPATGRISLSREARDVIDVQTAEVTREIGTDRLRAYASLVSPWNKYAFVTARMPGRVAALHVRPGEVVESGRIVAELDSLELQTMQFDYQKAVNDAELSSRILNGLRPAVNSGAVPEQRLAEAELAHQQNLNRLKVLQSKSVALGIPEELIAADGDRAPIRLPVRSPINGVVVHADLAVGKVIEPTEHLMDVVDLSTVWVKIAAAEREWHRVSAGQSVTLTLTGLPDRVFETKVDKLGLQIDPRTQQGIVWAEIDNPADGSVLRPGMWGVATIGSENSKPTLAVPSQAVFSDGAERYVLVEESSTKEGSEYQKVPVVVGRQSGGQAELLAGKIIPGDRVVTRGGHQLSSLFFQGVLRVGPETARAIGLNVEPVTMNVVEEVLTFDGRIEVPAYARTEASSQLDGKLIDIRVDRGQSVKRGDILADIASLEFQDLQLELLQAHLDHEIWQETLSRRQSAADSLAGKTILETEGRVTTLRAQVQNLRQKLRVLGVTADQIDEVLQTGRVMEALPLRASIDGSVVEFSGTLGQVVRADEPLFEIHDTSNVWVQAFVGERDAGRVEVGQSARIRLVAYPEFEAEGTVARVGAVVGQDSRTRATWIEFHSPPEHLLQQNMLARVTATTQQPPPTLAVPAEAVVRDGLRSFVFVWKTDGTFERRLVEAGDADDRFVEIRRGLALGESIAVSGVSELQTAFAAVR